MVLTESARLFLEGLKTARFNYEYYPGAEVVTITTASTCGQYIVDFNEYLSEAIQLPIISMEFIKGGFICIKFTIGDKRWLQVRRNGCNIICLDGQVLTKYVSAKKNDEILILDDSLYLPNKKIVYEKEGIYYDIYLNEIAPIPLYFIRPADLKSGSMELINPECLYMVGSSLVIVFGNYIKMPRVKRISDPMFAVQAEDGIKYALVSYRNKNNEQCQCLTNSTELIPFMPIVLYVPKENESLVFKNVTAEDVIYKAGDVFLTYNDAERHSLLFREVEAINPKCGQFTKPAPRDDII